MHQALKGIQEQLKIVITQLQSTIPNDDPFANAHDNWTFPNLSRSELVEEVQSIVTFIEDHETDDLGESESLIADYIRRLEYLHSQTVPNIWGNPGRGVPVFKFTMDALRKALSSVLTEDTHGEASKKLRELRRRLRSMEAQLNRLEPHTVPLTSMVERIEQAYNAADQLPTDLEALTEAREQIGNLVLEATQDQVRIVGIREEIDELDTQINASAETARVVLERCETAYSAATSVGLAAAFSERSKALSNSMWFWIIGLLAHSIRHEARM
jgi:DNA repair exonuclease SbcCD ATPase subunit